MMCPNVFFDLYNLYPKARDSRLSQVALGCAGCKGQIVGSMPEAGNKQVWMHTDGLPDGTTSQTPRFSPNKVWVPRAGASNDCALVLASCAFLHMMVTFRGGCARETFKVDFS